MLFALVLTAFADVPPPIVNGAETEDYRAVIHLVAIDSRGNGGGYCSGTLIAADWVLTAAHCVEALDDYDRQGNTNYAMFGYDINSAAGQEAFVEIDEWYEHPGYNTNDIDNGDDIGIVHLVRPIAGLDFMPVYKDGFTRSDEGDDFRYVGFGITSDRAWDSGVKRTADIPLLQYDSGIAYGYDQEDQQNVCSGDSGGAMFKIRSDGVLELAGVNSFVTDRDSTPCVGGMSGATRVDNQLDWIEGYTPVFSADELEESDADADADSDSDSDADADSDTDADADGDADGDGDDDKDGVSGDLADDPETPDDVGEDYATRGIACGCETGSGGAAAGLGLVLVALASRRRRT